MTKTLNLDENIKLLCIKALNKHKSKRAAARALGIPEKSLYNNIDRFDLCQVFGTWQVGILPGCGKV